MDQASAKSAQFIVPAVVARLITANLAQVWADSDIIYQAAVAPQLVPLATMEIAQPSSVQLVLTAAPVAMVPFLANAIPVKPITPISTIFSMELLLAQLPVPAITNIKWILQTSALSAAVAVRRAKQPRPTASLVVLPLLSESTFTSTALNAF